MALRSAVSARYSSISFSLSPAFCRLASNRYIVVEGEAVPDGKTGLGGLPDIERVVFLIVSDMKHISTGYLEYRRLQPRQGGELLRRHILATSFTSSLARPMP